MVIDEALRTLIDNIAHDNITTETRDKAIILLHATKLRRSELAALNTDDLQFLSDGRLEITMTSGTNRYHKSQSQIVVEREDQNYRPIYALESWFTILNISSGPLSVGQSSCPYSGNDIDVQTISLC